MVSEFFVGCNRKKRRRSSAASGFLQAADGIKGTVSDGAALAEKKKAAA
jgi:hypothetical protein